MRGNRHYGSLLFMMTLGDIERTALAIGKQTFGLHAVKAVHAEDDTDAAGQDAIRITIVMTRRGAQALKGDRLLSMLNAFRGALWNEGEARTPKLRYATEQELAEIGNPES